MSATLLETPLLAAPVALLAYLILIAVTLRKAGQQRALIALLACAALVFFPAASMLLSSYGSAVTWRFASFYSCGVAMVIFIYGAVLKSLSLRMLAFMATRPGGTASVVQLTTVVISPQLEERIAILQASGLVELQSDGYVATHAGRAFVHRLVRLHDFFKIESSGLYWS